MIQMRQKVKNQAHNVTLETTIVSIRESLNHTLTVRAVAIFQKSIWPLIVISAAALSSVLWTFALFWLIGHFISVSQ